jgi:hypothetical protein
MPFPALKDYLRRRQLTKAGIVPRLQVPTWSAGARSGVWTVIPDLLSADSVVYSVGVGDNISLGSGTDRAIRPHGACVRSDSA